VVSRRKKEPTAPAHEDSSAQWGKMLESEAAARAIKLLRKQAQERQDAAEERNRKAAKKD